MLVVPSIQLRSGVFVASRTRADDDGRSTEDPIAAARDWAAAGYQRLQVVDLDGATAASQRATLVEEISRNTDLEIQAAGDVSTTDDIERLADAGASLIVLGSRALDDPDWLSRVADLFPGALVVASDVNERKVTTRGWVRNVRTDLLDLADDLEGVPLAGLLVRDAHTDSQWSGSELALFEHLADRGGPPLFIELTSIDLADLRALENRGVSAAVLPESVLRDALDARVIAREFAD
jgi:phosphoribosylformimino-5-aminoimidazole carboxamide ribotide isomerase